MTEHFESKGGNELPEEIHFGDVVVLPGRKNDEEHVIVGVASNTGEDCCDTSLIYQRENGEEVLGGPGGVPLNRIKRTIGRWETDRVIESLGRGGIFRSIEGPVKQQILDFFRKEAAERPSRKIR